ncbi:oligosaccharide flippase family protein [Capnocytophaga canis]|uniref:oligosaccharide flippase family protein n=1 Tax=Capnocytophaga canis TaxID=1848903 RepID=UPI00370D7DA0
MRGLFLNLFSKLGVDGAIFYTSLARLVQSGGGILTLLLISEFMSEEEQGFYYTFTSVLAIQIFFELGLGGVITQFIAHEMTFLKVQNDNLEGKEQYKSRIASIVRFVLKWYGCFSLLLIITLITIGTYFFENYSVNMEIEWRVPWFLVSIFAGVNLLLSPVTAILQGMNRIKEVAKIQTIQQVILLFAVWAGLIFGAKLYVTVMSSAFGALLLIMFYYLFSYFRLFRNIFKVKVKQKVEYWQEIFPYQWRIALSWMSGYFIFQILNPIVFASYGAIIAGKVGMSLSIMNAILSFVLGWTSTKIPLWSSLIVKKEYTELDKSRQETIKKSTFITIMLILMSTIVILGLQYFEYNLGDRLLPWYLCFVLFVSVLFSNIVNIWATMLRCFKKEPFLVVSVVVAMFSVIELYITAQFFNLSALIIGYFLVISMISFPLGWYVFSLKRKEYYE